MNIRKLFAREFCVAIFVVLWILFLLYAVLIGGEHG